MASAAYWLVPSLFCLWLYWYGLHTWFLEDDFAWLGLNAQIHDARSFWHAVFSPTPQGTIRPLSERLFFIVFWHLFGWDAFWYRALVFATQFLNLVLLSAIVFRLTRSRVAAFFAPVLWTANSVLSVAMAWSSGYNEILCGTFLLGAFFLLLRLEETGNWRWYWAQMLVFLIGFGALELNLIYPALALCWALLRVRPGRISTRTLALSTLPLFVFSGAFYWIHATAAPPQTTGPYSMQFDAALPQTFWTYCQWVFVPPLWQPLTQLDPRLGTAAFWILGLSLLAFVAWQAARANRLPAFFLAWFVITIAPLVPLREHVSDYYLSIPSLGVAAAGALGIARAWHSSAVFKFAAVFLATLYLAVQIPVARSYTAWHYDRSRGVRDLVLGVERAHQLHPDKTILLKDVSPDLYANAIAHQPFRLISGARVYLAPESESSIGNPPAHLARVSAFSMPAGAAGRALEAGQLEVYSTRGARLHNITDLYTRSVPLTWTTAYPSHVDAGSSFLDYSMGAGWYTTDGAYRWMPAQATLKMSGPRTPGERLYLHGYCARQLIAQGPATVTASVDGKLVGRFVLSQPDSIFDESFALPPSTVGKPEISIQLNVNRTFTEEPTGRLLALAFGTFEIR